VFIAIVDYNQIAEDQHLCPRLRIAQIYRSENITLWHITAILFLYSTTFFIIFRFILLNCNTLQFNRIFILNSYSYWYS